MHKGEMGYIQEILDGARAAGVVGVRAAVDFVKGGIVPLRKFRHVAGGIAERNPYPIVLLLCLVDFCMRRGGRLLVGMSGETHALPLFVIGPAVIGANQAIMLYFSKRKACSPVQAQVTPCMDLLANT